VSSFVESLEAPPLPGGIAAEEGEAMEGFDDALGALDDDDDAYECPVCYEPSKYGLSAECMHFYCGDCIRRTLETILEMGQFPAYCPQCRAESGGLPEPEKGRIEGPALSFLRGRGVIDKALQYRFLVEAASIRRDEYLKCPQESCHQYLKDIDPIWQSRGGDVVMKPGECASCHSRVCCACHVLVAKDGHHVCPPDSRAKAVVDEATKKLMASMCKLCPMWCVV
jgi:hypothetical protein